MPTIIRKPLSEKQVKYKHEVEIRNSDFYNSGAWKRLRNTLLSRNPLCYECLQHGRVVPATDAHHLIPFMSGDSEEERWNLFLKDSNIRMLCDTCHHAYHNKMRQYNMKSVFDLTASEYKYAHGLNYQKEIFF